MQRNTFIFPRPARFKPSRLVQVRKHWQSFMLSIKSCCRPSSSSESTSSSMSTGASSFISLIKASSESLSDSAAVRFWPWEPKVRTSMPDRAMPISSRWGPAVVKPLRRSSALLLSSAFSMAP